MIENLIPAALYAETHFRFFGWSPSALFRKEPEIIFDLPRRLTADHDLPVALLINDIDRFPIAVESVNLTVSAPGGDRKQRRFDFGREDINDSTVDQLFNRFMSAYLLTIPRSELPSGDIFVNACLRYRRINKKGAAEKHIRVALNDNLVTSSKFPYRCFVGSERYPGHGECVFGDIHCHSMFSRSHVEWGPPPAMIGAMAAACGLDFAAVTDHSYDLACDPDDYLRQDKDLRLWRLYRSSVENYNNGRVILIPGEEVSVANSKRTVVHLGALGVTDYIPGSLDGARKNVHFKKQLTIEEAADEIERQGGISFAAHPGARAGFFQALFLSRGEWCGADLCEKLNALQIVNDGFNDSWVRSKSLWISALQEGRKPPILAGSDAHGDFNRYRAVTIPFLQIGEDADRYMGFVRTGVYGKRNNAGEIINGIRDGATFITNGPFVMICDDGDPERPLINSRPLADTSGLRVRACSAKEFGEIKNIKVMMGRPGIKGEKVIVDRSLLDDTYDADIPIPAKDLPDTCYLRTEVFGVIDNNAPVTAATSACFIGY